MTVQQSSGISKTGALAVTYIGSGTLGGGTTPSGTITLSAEAKSRKFLIGLIVSDSSAVSSVTSMTLDGNTGRTATTERTTSANGTLRNIRFWFVDIDPSVSDPTLAVTIGGGTPSECVWCAWELEDLQSETVVDEDYQTNIVNPSGMTLDVEEGGAVCVYRFARANGYTAGDSVFTGITKDFDFAFTGPSQCGAAGGSALTASTGTLDVDDTTAFNQSVSIAISLK